MLAGLGDRFNNPVHQASLTWVLVAIEYENQCGDVVGYCNQLITALSKPNQDVANESASAVYQICQASQASVHVVSSQSPCHATLHLLGFGALWCNVHVLLARQLDAVDVDVHVQALRALNLHSFANHDIQQFVHCPTSTA
jgi:hypothetical protein